MFGLMQTSPCATASARTERNKHYCGTCKSLGGLYGQRYRMLLNADAVFMGEVLSALAAKDDQAWKASCYGAMSCFSLPASPDEVPVVLRYSAACTLLLTELALRDKIADATFTGPSWRVGKRLLSEGVTRACNELRAMGVDLDRVWQAAESQTGHERDVESAGKGARALTRYSDPTATIAGYLFAHGAVLVGRPDCAARLDAIGRSFGRIVYVLDAIRDYEADQRSRGFNAIAAAWRSSASALTPAVRAEAGAYVLREKDQIVTLTGELHADPAIRRSFIDRLEGNIHVNLHDALPVHWMTEVKSKERPRTIRGRWAAAKQQASALAIRTQVIRRDGMTRGLSQASALAFLTLVCLFAPLSAGQVMAQGQESSGGDAGGAICGLIILALLVGAVVNAINKATRKTGVVVVHKKGACE